MGFIYFEPGNAHNEVMKLKEGELRAGRVQGVGVLTMEQDMFTLLLITVISTAVYGHETILFFAITS
jgi:hypothetical protein